MKIEHFSHEHPLIHKEDNVISEKVVCYACQEPIIGGNSAAYSCSHDCDFFLHKKCAEVAKEINHPMHDEHPLILLAYPPNYDSVGLRCLCMVCKRPWNCFTYNCSHCELDICVTCGSKDTRFEHQGHPQHVLTLVQREALFSCDACGVEDKGSSYACNTCQFWVHKVCATLPNTFEVSFHDHPLVLAYSLPDIYCRFSQYCHICTEKLNPSDWLYYCAECRYFAHLKCVQWLEEEILIQGEEETEACGHLDDTNLRQFPMSKGSLLDLMIDHFGKLVNLEDEVVEVAVQLDNISHDHPLYLIHQIEIKNNIENRVDEILCNGCVQPISMVNPFYGCIQCNFFLHKFCAELPIELQHPCHPEHSLNLKFHSNFFDFHTCEACDMLCNGIIYTCEICELVLDIRCSLLPNRIKHEAHKHPLVQREISENRCMACGFDMEPKGMEFGCETCTYEKHAFQIHQKCTLLPSTIKHRWDRHPIPLMYPPFTDYLQVLYCEICEEEIDTNYWLYHCRECDRSFHTQCLNGVHNIKFGGKLEVQIHPHPLTFFDQNTEHLSNLCGRCGVEQQHRQPVLECAQCSFLLCTTCALYTSDLITQHPLMKEEVK